MTEAMSGTRLALTNTMDEPAVTTEEPVVTTEEPAVTAEEPIVTTEEPAVTAEEPTVTTEEPAVTAEEPIVTTEEPIELPTTEAPEKSYQQLSCQAAGDTQSSTCMLQVTTGRICSSGGELITACDQVYP